MSVRRININEEEISTNNLSFGDNPIISSFIPALKTITKEAAIQSKIDISLLFNINEPKKAQIKNAPNDTPKPPK